MAQPQLVGTYLEVEYRSQPQLVGTYLEVEYRTQPQVIGVYLELGTLISDTAADTALIGDTSSVNLNSAGASSAVSDGAVLVDLGQLSVNYPLSVVASGAVASDTANVSVVYVTGSTTSRITAVNTSAWRRDSTREAFLRKSKTGDFTTDECK